MRALELRIPPPIFAALIALAMWLQPERTSALVTTGVYRITRNPMYVGLLLGLLAWAAGLSSPVSLAGPVAFIMAINRFQIEPEEKALLAKFGPEYETYKSAVRRWL